LNQNAGEPLPMDSVSAVFAAYCWFAVELFCKLGSFWARCVACSLHVSMAFCHCILCYILVCQTPQLFTSWHWLMYGHLPCC